MQKHKKKKQKNEMYLFIFDTANPAFNHRYIDVFVTAQHHDNRFIKLICKIRLNLKPIYELSKQREQIDLYFGRCLGKQDMKEAVKAVRKEF